MVGLAGLIRRSVLIPSGLNLYGSHPAARISVLTQGAWITCYL